MGLFNTLTTELPCPACAMTSTVRVQFKFGHVWQLEYAIGDALRWDTRGNVGSPGCKRVLVDGIVERPCPACGEDDWDALVLVERDRIVSARTNPGQQAVPPDATFVVLEG